MSAVRVGWDEIKAGYKMYEHCPYFSFYDSNGRGKPGRLLFSYKGDDRNGAGWDLLKENLEVAEANTPSTEYVVMFYDDLGKGGRLDSTTPYSGSFNLRMRPFEGRSLAISGVSAPNDFNAFLKEQLHEKDIKILELEECVRELERHLDEADKAAVTGVAPQSDIGQITGLVKQLRPFLDMFMKPRERDQQHYQQQHHQPPPPRPQYRPQEGGGISGVPPAAETENVGDVRTSIDQSLTILQEWFAKEYGNMATPAGRLKGMQHMAGTFSKLAELATNNPGKLKTALAFL